MKLLSKEYIQNLKTRETDYNVSIFIPTFEANKDEQNRIGFKNAIKEVKSTLKNHNVSEERIESILKPIEKLANIEGFWSQQAKGLSIYANEHVMEYARLPIHFEAMTYVGEEFYFKPVLSLLDEDYKAYLMSVSSNKIRLFSVSKHEIVEHNIENEFPKNLDESHWHLDREKTLQGHQSGRTIFNGQGAGKDTKEEDIKRFFRDVNTGLEDLFRGEKTKLILAGTEETIHFFKQSFQYNFIHENHIQGNHDETTALDLYKNVMEILDKDYHEQLAADLHKVKEIKHTNKVSTSIKEVVKSSIIGNVETLYIKKGETKWAYINNDNLSVEIQKEKTNGQVDAINSAAIETLLKGGEVKVLEEELIEDFDASLVAVLRS